MCRLGGIVSRQPAPLKALVDWTVERSPTFPDGHGAVVYSESGEPQVVRGAGAAGESDEYKALGTKKGTRAGFWIRSLTDGTRDKATQPYPLDEGLFFLHNGSIPRRKEIGEKLQALVRPTLRHKGHLSDLNDSKHFADVFASHRSAETGGSFERTAKALSKTVVDIDHLATFHDPRPEEYVAVQEAYDKGQLIQGLEDPISGDGILKTGLNGLVVGPDHLAAVRWRRTLFASAIPEGAPKAGPLPPDGTPVDWFVVASDRSAVTPEKKLRAGEPDPYEVPPGTWLGVDENFVFRQGKVPGGEKLGSEIPAGPLPADYAAAA